MENNDPGYVVTNIHANPGIIVTIKPSTEASSSSEWFEIKDSQLILKKSVDFEVIQWRGAKSLKSSSKRMSGKSFQPSPLQMH